MLFETLAMLCAGLFAGAAIYVTLVEHPARLECGTALAVTEFGPSYRRGAAMQASLAALSLVTGIVAWVQERSLAVLTGSVIVGLPLLTGPRRRLRRSSGVGGTFTPCEAF